MERARPSAALNSSTHPYASTRGSAFDNRRPYISDVSPLSPVLVTMDMSSEAGVLECWSKGVMGSSPHHLLLHYSIPVTRSQVAARLLRSPAPQQARLFPQA